MKLRTTIISALIFSGGIVFALSSKEKSAEIIIPPIAIFTHALVDTIDGVLFTAATDKISYKSGDSLRVRYSITNHSMATVLYDFTTSCQFELHVIGSSGNILYSLLAPRLTTGRTKACEPVSSHLMLAPSTGKNIEFDAVQLKLMNTDTLTVKAQMAGYPLSAIPLKIVYQTDSTAPEPIALEGTAGMKPALEFNNETKTLVIRVNRAQRLTISAFILTGQKIDKLSCEKFLAPGTHLINFKNRKLTNGVVIFKVEGNGFSETKTINLAR